MDAIASPLVLTKLRVPATRPRHLPRARLMERLTPEAGANIILVCAPAGYGKTTLLSEWARGLTAQGTAVAWFSIDPGDDDPPPFGHYLVAALTQALGPAPELSRVAQLLQSSPDLDLQTVLPAIINTVAAGGRDCALILDDYHLIAVPAIHAAMAFLLERLPENMRVALGSRSEPPLPVARWRARGRLLEVRAADLRFTPDETARFLNEVMRLDLPAALTAALEERTEGWIAGLQLAALSLPDRPDRAAFLSSFSGGHRYLVEYLLEEVVGHQPQHVQSFLFSTSILERLCGPLCDAVLGAEQGPADASAPRPASEHVSASILEELEHTNLFLIPLDDERRWYRYHHLFRDFLQSRLDKTHPDRVPDLHRAAAEWYAANGLLSEAVRHALQTRDWDYAADCVERHGFTLIARGELATLSGWCAAFPEEVFGTRPVLCLLQSWPLVMRLRRQNRDRVEARLRQVEGLAAVLEDQEQAGALIEHAAVLRSYLALAPDPAADARAQLALARSRLGTDPQEDAGRLSALLTAGYAHMALHDAKAATEALEAAGQVALHGQLYAGIIESAFHLARLAHVQGDLRRAAEICRRGQADLAALLPHPEQQLPAGGCLDVALGCILLDQDRQQEAEQALLTGFDRIGWGALPHYLMAGCLALYRLRGSQGRSPEALDYLTRLEEAWPDIAFCTRGLRAVRALQASPGDPAATAEAASWCDAVAPLFGDDVPPPGMGPFGAAEVYYLASLAWARAQIALGRSRAALPYLRRQLELAMSHGLTHRIHELTLLESQAARAEGRPALGPCPETGESLTERELEVLRLMAQGASNQAIAEQLVITVGTVKSHINHVLGKLNAHNRNEAVARARALGWLET